MSQKQPEDPSKLIYPEEKSPNENYIAVIDNDVILNFLNECENNTNTNKK